MKGLRNRVGETYGRWKVIAQDKKDPKSWLCECQKCHTQKVFKGTALCAGHYKRACECWINPKIKDLTGHKFGRLTVTSFAYTKNEKSYWNCECECGGTTVARGNDLMSKRVKSCGCAKREKSMGETEITKILKKNNIHFHAEYFFSDFWFEDTHRRPRFDFAILDEYDVCLAIIEYHGSQHYGPGGWESEAEFLDLRRRDNLKIKYLEDNSIPYLIVNWDNFLELEEIILKFLKEKGAI